MATKPAPKAAARPAPSPKQVVRIPAGGGDVLRGSFAGDATLAGDTTEVRSIIRGGVERADGSLAEPRIWTIQIRSEAGTSGPPIPLYAHVEWTLREQPMQAEVDCFPGASFSIVAEHANVAIKWDNIGIALAALAGTRVWGAMTPGTVSNGRTTRTKTITAAGFSGSIAVPPFARAVMLFADNISAGAPNGREVFTSNEATILKLSQGSELRAQVGGAQLMAMRQRGHWFELPGRTSHFSLTTAVAVRHDVCFLIGL